MPVPLAWDSETALIGPGLLAPPLVCVTWQTPGEEARIEHHSTIEPRFRAWLENPEILFIGHNIAFDFAVLCERFPHLRPLVFAAYDADRVTDTMIRQWLLDNAAGMLRGRVDKKGKWLPREYSLEAVAKYVGMQLRKDAWRLSYGHFLDTPCDQWLERGSIVQHEAKLILDGLAKEFGALGKLPKSRRTKEQNARYKALTKEIDGLREMIASDPRQCLEYPLDDARATLKVFLAQEKHAARYLADQFRQAQAYFALYLNSAWGLRTDAAGIRILKRQLENELAEIEDDLKSIGIVRADGSRDTKLAKLRMIEACREVKLPVIRTDGHPGDRDSKMTLSERIAKGLKPICKAADGSPLDDGDDRCAEHVCLDADACEAVEDKVIRNYAEYTTLQKVLSNDIVALENGIIYPVHTKYGFAGTGRVTSSKSSVGGTNVQNISKREGIREAIVPRPGHLLAGCDYPMLELYALAQCCMSWFGYSKLAEALNEGKDLHLWVASIILKISYEEAEARKNEPQVDKARELAKPANYGFPGGMGIKTFLVSTRKKEGRERFKQLGLDGKEGERLARQLFDYWLEAWPEMHKYRARVEELCDTDSGRASVESLFTGRWRGGATYCATSNNGFQALGADIAKRAGWLIAKACYVEQFSPLFNARPNAMVHDEYFAEVAEEPGSNGDAHDAAVELGRLMNVAANEFLPDVPMPPKKMKPYLTRRLSKKAKPTLDEAGRLIPWAA